MKRKIKSVKGFTLAELLIVVAIIAVLVAIGIPIFTSQLEKSREAVDLSDVRSAYAEVMMAAITGDTTAIYTKDANQTIYKQAENVYSITVKPLKQKQDGWQTALPITIGGVSSTDNAHWVGTPGANGECVITYVPPTGAADEAVKFEWKGGTGEDNSGTGGNGGGISGGNSGTGEDNGNNSGNGGSGEDNNSGGTTNSGNSDGNKDFTSIVDAWGGDWPEKPEYIEGNGGNQPTIHLSAKKGQIISYHGNFYVFADGTAIDYDANCWDYANPENEAGGRFIKLTGTVRYSSEVVDENIKNIHVGDLYQAASGFYVYHGYSIDHAVPNGTTEVEQWIKVIGNSSKTWPT